MRCTRHLWLSVLLAVVARSTAVAAGDSSPWSSLEFTSLAYADDASPSRLEVLGDWAHEFAGGVEAPKISSALQLFDVSDSGAGTATGSGNGNGKGGFSSASASASASGTGTARGTGTGTGTGGPVDAATCARQRCNGNGDCLQNGKCICKVGFTGSACQQCRSNFFGTQCNVCPGAQLQSETGSSSGSACSGQGRCMDGASGSGKCVCNAGRHGDDCGSVNVCGNGIVEPGEQCDAGSSSASASRLRSIILHDTAGFDSLACIKCKLQRGFVCVDNASKKTCWPTTPDPSSNAPPAGLSITTTQSGQVNYQVEVSQTQPTVVSFGDAAGNSVTVQVPADLVPASASLSVTVAPATVASTVAPPPTGETFAGTFLSFDVASATPASGPNFAAAGPLTVTVQLNAEQGCQRYAGAQLRSLGASGAWELASRACPADAVLQALTEDCRLVTTVCHFYASAAAGSSSSTSVAPVLAAAGNTGTLFAVTLPASTTEPNESATSGPSAGVIAGAVVGSVAGATLVVAAALLIYRRRAAASRKSGESLYEFRPSPTTPTPPAAAAGLQQQQQQHGAAVTSGRLQLVRDAYATTEDPVLPDEGR